MHSIIFVQAVEDVETGAHGRFERLIRAAARRGYNVTVITPGEKSSSYGRVQIKLGRTALRRPRILWLAVGVLLKWQQVRRLKDHGGEVVLVFGETTLLAGYLVAKATGGFFSVGVRSNRIKREKILQRHSKSLLRKAAAVLRFRVVRWLLSIIYDRSDQIIVQADFAKDEFLENFSVSSTKIEVVENDAPIIASEWEARAFRPPVPESLLFLGGSSIIKGSDILMEAIPRMHEFLPSLRWVTVVGVEKSDRQRWEREVANTVVYTMCHGRRNDVVALMSRHDLVVVPSREDQFPNVVLEAAATGTPVIGAKADGICYLLLDSWVLFEPTPESLLKCLGRLSSPAGYGHAVEALENVKRRRRFDWPKVYLRSVFQAVGSGERLTTKWNKRH